LEMGHKAAINNCERSSDAAINRESSTGNAEVCENAEREF